MSEAPNCFFGSNFSPQGRSSALNVINGPQITVLSHLTVFVLEQHRRIIS